jgi:prepilin-type N-terminal cleavage/methylation domain-containing protein
MASHAPSLTRQRGFSLIEMLSVVLIVAVMAAVAFPNIMGYLKNYKIKGAAQLVAGELQAARSRAIMSNTNQGVSFVVVDRESYRFVSEDVEATSPERLSGLKKLPSGILFVENTALADRGATLRFQRLGGFCNPAATSTTCDDAVDVAERSTSEEAGLLDTGSVDGPYIGARATGTMEIRVREGTTGLERTIQIAPGGRVLPQP